MKKQALLYSLVMAVSFSCIEPEKPEAISSGEVPAQGANAPIPDASGPTPIAAKNYKQFNNTLSKKTGVSTSQTTVLSEYNAILMQLPTTSDPTSLNGFNQIAQSRLAFAYCDAYMDDKYDSDYKSLSDADLIKLLLNNMIDVDLVNNESHQALYAHLMSIMSDEDQLVNDNNATSKREKLQS